MKAKKLKYSSARNRNFNHSGSKQYCHLANGSVVASQMPCVYQHHRLNFCLRTTVMFADAVEMNFAIDEHPLQATISYRN